MKNKFISVIIVILLLFLLPQAAEARKGVGIVWNTENEIVNEDSTNCIEYGLYNPWDEDVNAYLSVSDELKDIITSEHSEPKVIKGKTMHNAAVPVKICFKIAKVYSEDCLWNGQICEQRCEESQVIYTGKIKTMEKESGLLSGAGSATALGVSVPLTLKVRCNSHSRDWSLVYIIVIGVVLSAIGILLYKRRGKKR